MDKKFLDKVLDQLVSETRIDYENERMYTPFPFPSFLTSLTVFDLFSSLYSSSNYVFTFFTTHCKEIYGLNEEEREYVWKEYIEIISDKLNSKGNINESTGMDTKFLDKVVGQLVSETEIDYEWERVGVPYIRTTFRVVNLDDRFISNYFPHFKKHCKGVYGIKDDQEIEYVWFKYGEIIKGKINSKKNINESREIDYKFLDKVVGQLISETRLEYTVGIFTPFRENPFQMSLVDSRFFSSGNPPSSFSTHMRGVYSISEWGEIIYLWGMYKQILKDKINSKGNINESIEMDKKFLDRVADQIVSETIIDDGKLYTPFINSHFTYSYHFSSLYPFFNEHCKTVYSLKDIKEIRYVWGEYNKSIKGKINSKKNINESTGMDTRFIDKVAEQIMSETVIKMVTDDDGNVTGSFETPFNGKHPLPSIFTSFFTNNFYEHCVEVYGIKDYNEIHQIWDKYKSLVRTETGQPQCEYQSNRLF